MNTLKLTTNLLTRKYDNVKILLKDAASNEEHALFIFAKDFAREILARDLKYTWLVDKIDDLNSLVVKQLQNFIKNYYLNVLFVTKVNKLTIYFQKNDIENAIKWLMSRYISLLKNLFDKKSSKAIDNIQFFYFNSLENGEELLTSPSLI